VVCICKHGIKPRGSLKFGDIFIAEKLLVSLEELYFVEFVYWYSIQVIYA
jgi:hypothetical protein